MAGRLARNAMLLLLALVAAPIGDSPAESNALLATLNQSATFTAARPASSDLDRTAAARRARLIISVTDYQPANDGTSVEAVVRARVGDGAEHEVGRFGITPDRPFTAATPEDALRFSLPLPSEFTTDKPVTFSVQLVPGHPAQAAEARKAGAEPDNGASLRIGGAEIR